MRGVSPLLNLAVVGLVSALPMPALGQAITQKDVVGTWRNLEIYQVAWDSTTGKIAVRMEERRLTLRPDGTYTSGGRVVTDSGTRDSKWALKGLGFPVTGNTGSWSLTGDTLVARYSAADSAAVIDSLNARKEARASDYVLAPERLRLSRSGDTLMTWIADNVLPQQWVRVDTTQPLPLDPPPPTLKRADLVGVWVGRASMAAAGRSDTVSDTLVLRADSTWAANAQFDKYMIISGCGLGGVKDKPSAKGTWYLAPANTLVLIDSLRRQVCSVLGHWRDGPVKLQGQQLIPQTRVSPAYPTYTRVSATPP